MDQSKSAAPYQRRSDESELRSAVQYAVIELCSKEDAASTTRMSAKAISALAELTFLYATTSLSSDLESFCSHAGRKTITEADVKLVARKNPDDLLEKLDDYCSEKCDDYAGKTIKKRKRREIICLDSIEKKPEPKEEDCSSTSSVSPELVAAAEAAKEKPVAIARKGVFDGLSDSDDNSKDDDTLEPTFRKPATTTRKKPAKTPFSDDSSLSSGDDKPASKAVAPKNRFRLGKSLDEGGSSSEEDDIVLSASAAQAGGTRIKRILQGLSQDSLLSLDSRGKENSAGF